MEVLEQREQREQRGQKQHARVSGWAILPLRAA